MTRHRGRPASLLQTLAADRALVEVISSLRRHDITPILLKGPAIANWLYPDGDRRYVDLDLLVRPSDLARTGEILAAAGFVPDDRGLLREDRSAHATDWKRTGDEWAVVDLHSTVHGAHAHPERVWDVLRKHATTSTHFGAEVLSLDMDALAAQIVLHAAASGGRRPQPVRDLGRLVEVLDDDAWLRAAAIAADLEAMHAFVTGLLLVPEGAVIARTTGLDVSASPQFALAARDPEAVEPTSLIRFAGLSGLRRLHYVVRKLVPRRAFMMEWEYGPRSLPLKYVYRVWFVLARLPSSVISYWRRRS